MCTKYIVSILSCLVVLPIRKEVDHVHLLLGEGLLELHVAVDSNVRLKLCPVRGQDVEALSLLSVPEHPALGKVLAPLQLLLGLQLVTFAVWVMIQSLNILLCVSGISFHIGCSCFV